MITEERIVNGADPYDGWNKNQAVTNYSDGVYLRQYPAVPVVYGYIEQTVDLSDVSVLTFQLMPASAGAATYIGIELNGARVSTLSKTGTTWSSNSIDVSAYGSGTSVKFVLVPDGGGKTGGIYIKNVSAIATIYYPPVASFTGIPVSGKTPLTVQFTDTSTNTPTSWAWNFGDGTTATNQNPAHTYTSAGVYTVSLTATNGDGSNTKIIAGYVVITERHPAIIVFQMIPSTLRCGVMYFDGDARCLCYRYSQEQS